MENTIIAIYCLCDDYLHLIAHRDWHNARITTSEAMTACLVAMRFYGGNIEHARHFLLEHRYISRNFGKSCLNKRLHHLPEEFWHGLLSYVQEWVNLTPANQEYIVDTFPIAACRNIRISRCRLYEGNDFHGYNASKREFFYGLKVTVLALSSGCPHLVRISPGKEHDITSFKALKSCLPKGSTIYGDAAYLDYKLEDELEIEYGIHLVAERKSNSKRLLSLHDWTRLKHIRKRIETTFSMISTLLPKKIHAITSKGFEMKVLCFVISCAIMFIIN